MIILTENLRWALILLPQTEFLSVYDQAPGSQGQNCLLPSAGEEGSVRCPFFPLPSSQFTSSGREHLLPCCYSPSCVWRGGGMGRASTPILPVITSQQSRTGTEEEVICSRGRVGAIYFPPGERGDHGLNQGLSMWDIMAQQVMV